MRVLVTGSNGQLGSDVIKELIRKNIDHLGTTSAIMDVRDKNSVIKIIQDFKPDVIIHCAAYTKVDDAEDDRINCYNTNVIGTRNLVEASKKLGTKFIYISTDYVFDGSKNLPYETYDTPNPINYYGYTKYLGEKTVIENVVDYCIIRTSWVFGSMGNNFVKTILRIAESNDCISVISDQFGSPTYSVDLANKIIQLIEAHESGVFHITNEGYTSWCEFAREIISQNGLMVKVIEISTSEYITKARRPLDSRLSKESIKKIGKLRYWKDAVREFTNEVQQLQR